VVPAAPRVDSAAARGGRSAGLTPAGGETTPSVLASRLVHTRWFGAYIEKHTVAEVTAAYRVHRLRAALLGAVAYRAAEGHSSTGAGAKRCPIRPVTRTARGRPPTRPGSNGSRDGACLRVAVSSIPSMTIPNGSML
jgi:hypothetical protein